MNFIYFIKSLEPQRPFTPISSSCRGPARKKVDMTQQGCPFIQGVRTRNQPCRSPDLLTTISHGIGYLPFFPPPLHTVIPSKQYSALKTRTIPPYL